MLNEPAAGGVAVQLAAHHVQRDVGSLASSMSRSTRASAARRRSAVSSTTAGFGSPRPGQDLSAHKVAPGHRDLVGRPGGPPDHRVGVLPGLHSRDCGHVVIQWERGLL